MTSCLRFCLVGLALILASIIGNNTLLDVNRGGGRLKVHCLLRVSMPFGLWILSMVEAAIQIHLLGGDFCGE